MQKYRNNSIIESLLKYCKVFQEFANTGGYRFQGVVINGIQLEILTLEMPLEG